eukprot:TRINITY_DN27188_c0_g1_i2.p1 TRINITY_DN27188_c0_g1~~TRINITY_DN27188_c0_g1_i2.p1  ORF type:complete len:498 (-),score=58.86 TRINITY_DN27188_c0_g1_i2:19-1512(-)
MAVLAVYSGARATRAARAGIMAERARQQTPAGMPAPTATPRHTLPFQLPVAAPTPSKAAVHPTASHLPLQRTFTPTAQSAAKWKCGECSLDCEVSALRRLALLADGEPEALRLGAFIRTCFQRACPLPEAWGHSILRDLAPWCSVQSPSVSDLLQFVRKTNSAGSATQLSLYCWRIGYGLQHYAGPRGAWQFSRFLSSLFSVLGRDTPQFCLVLNAGDEPVVPRDCLDDGPRCPREEIGQFHGFPIKETSCQSKPTPAIPVFSTATIGDCFADILFPLTPLYALELPEETSLLPLEHRKASVFWRGSTTGHSLNGSNHRVRLVRYFHDHWGSLPLPADVGFSAVTQHGNSTSVETALKPLMRPRVKWEAHSNYRYLLDTDGNSYSQRLAGLLAFGAPVIRMGIFEDVVTRGLRAGEHYLAADLALKGMNDTLLRLRDDPLLVARVGAAGRRRIAELATPATLKCYAHHLMRRFLTCMPMNFSDDDLFSSLMRNVHQP